MIKILRAKHQTGYVIRLDFSDGTSGNLDVAPLLARNTPLTEGIREPEQFGRFFIDMGALCWPNGLELSPASIHRRLLASGALVSQSSVA
ncbi:MAG: DUF2442 domain-containing protein [Polyangiaceae bacterium]|nr:DUF2442 domain-containing protein [Polyangiaceae bacterium]